LDAKDSLKEAGIDETIIYCVNDGAVMTAWAEHQGVEHCAAGDGAGHLTFLADPTGDLTNALDMRLTHAGPASVGIIGRCKRFAVYAVNGIVRYVAVSEGFNDPAGDDDPSATLAPAVLAAISSLTNDEL